METVLVIKIGGNVIDNPSALESFLKDFASLNAKKILIHGGGKIATKLGGSHHQHHNFNSDSREGDNPIFAAQAISLGLGPLAYLTFDL